MEQYWAETPSQFIKRVGMFEKEEQRRFREVDTLNYYLGKYVGIAVNDPKKYPDNPFSHQEEAKEMTAEEMQRVAKAITNKIKAINNGNNT